MPVSLKKATICLNVISAAVPSARSLKDLTWSVKNKLHVCHEHFEDKYVRPSMRLTPNAWPTLFSSSEVNSGNPERLMLIKVCTINLFVTDLQIISLTEHIFFLYISAYMLIK